jgi:GntR family carbon starvation induced transcriptional regulator
MPTELGGRPKRSETHVSLITKELRQEIISGQLPPGGKLKVRQLAERFGVGLSPIRESLNRLSREWLVHHNELRGFSVSSVSEQDLDELMKARCWLNERALRESIAHGDISWEENVLLAYHRLSRIQRFSPEIGPKVNPAWEVAHRTFHRSLINGCGSRWVVEICDQLFDVADIYRHIARTTPDQNDREKEDEHRPIMEAAVARDADKAVGLLFAHFLRTAELCREPLRRLSSIDKKKRSNATP